VGGVVVWVDGGRVERRYLLVIHFPLAYGRQRNHYSLTIKIGFCSYSGHSCECGIEGRSTAKSL